jgi:ubiquinone/menaquinone biosynthesis C-methylase UbiE
LAFNTGDLGLLRCPESGAELVLRDGRLECLDGKHTYPISTQGIPLFASTALSEDAQRQQTHYDRIAHAYIQNLGYPHTQEYMRYLDDAFLRLTATANVSAVAEVCCGRAEGIALLKERIAKGVGVDISAAMLSAARDEHPEERFTFVQGDATRMPLRSAAFDTVLMLGGIHHVNDRRSLFREIARILKPGGRFIFREPVSDFALWRWLRAIVYRISPTLDAATERPLMYEETVPPLSGAGLLLREWATYGFAGYCLLMNSDVLVFNRLFRFIPGIRLITRFACTLDHLTVNMPGMARNGLIVIGVAEKPTR